MRLRFSGTWSDELSDDIENNSEVVDASEGFDLMQMKSENLNTAADDTTGADVFSDNDKDDNSGVLQESILEDASGKRFFQFRMKSFFVLKSRDVRVFVSMVPDFRTRYTYPDLPVEVIQDCILIDKLTSTLR